MGHSGHLGTQSNCYILFIICFHSPATPICVFTSKKICVLVLFLRYEAACGWEGIPVQVVPAFPWNPLILSQRNTTMRYFLSPRALGRDWTRVPQKTFLESMLHLVFQMQSSRGGTSPAPSDLTPLAVTPAILLQLLYTPTGGWKVSTSPGNGAANE